MPKPFSGRVLISLVLWFCVAFAVADSLGMTEQVVQWVRDTYGRNAGERVEAWRLLMSENTGRSEEEQLVLVNDFFNRIPYVRDKRLWGQEDYWATPLEALVRRGADCEDYSIAKYFTLRELGVAEEKLRIMYVKSMELNEAHMVLTYYPTPTAVPRVLDNLKPDILPATERGDLKPVYSFNAEGLWLAKSLGRGEKVGSSGRLSLWQGVKERMQKEMEQ